MPESVQGWGLGVRGWDSQASLKQTNEGGKSGQDLATVLVLAGVPLNI